MLERVAACALVVPFALGWLSSPSHPGDTVFRFQDSDIVESSGLVVEGGLFLTTNDSGDSGRVFAVDPDTGETVGVTHWSKDPTDVEALAPAGPGSVWVGDIGDNDAQRHSVEVTRVPVGASDRTVHEPTYELVYPHGAVNAETLLAQPRTGRLYVATKDVFGGALYAAPATLDPHRPNMLRRVAAVLPIATDGAFFPDGKHVILRDYSQAVVYTFPGMEQVGSFRLPDEQQGEGITVTPDGAIYVSSEGLHSPVLRVALPDDVRRALTPAATPAPGASSPSASGGTLSRAGQEQPEATSDERPLWPWLGGGVLLLGVLVVLRRALRPR